jgi:hypothetical protein
MRRSRNKAVQDDTFAVGSEWTGVSIHEKKRKLEGELYGMFARTPGFNSNMHYVSASDSKTLKIRCFSIPRGTAWKAENCCTFRINCSINKAQKMVIKDMNLVHCSAICPYMQPEYVARHISAFRSTNEGQDNTVVGSEVVDEAVDGEFIVTPAAAAVVNEDDEENTTDEVDKEIPYDGDSEDEYLLNEGRKRLPCMDILLYAKKRNANEFAVIRGTTPASFKESVKKATDIEIGDRTAQRLVALHLFLI